MQSIRLQRSSASETPTISIENISISKADKDHVVVKIRAAAIQPSDRLNARGGFNHTTFPRTPGRDFAGIVVDDSSMSNREVFGTGGGVLGYDTDGAHAEYCLIHKDMLATKPPSLSFIQAAAIGVPFTTALLCLRRARVTPNDSVLIIGSSGAVGSAAVQLAKALGATKVYSAARRETADVNLISDPTLSSLSDLTAGKGVDIVVDTVGSLELMSAAVPHLALRGRYTWVSAPRGAGAPIQYGLNLLETYRKELEFIGCNSASQSPEEVGADLEKLRALFEDGRLVAPDEGSLLKTSLGESVETYQTGKKLQVIVF